MVVVVIAIIAGVGAWYFMGGEEKPPEEKEGPTPQAPDKIKIGWPSPISGSLATFGEADMYVKKKLEDYINKDGGIYLSKYDQKVPIEILSRDTESNPKAAASVAEVLATKEKVDMFLVLHTAATTVPVCGIAEKHGIPTVSLDTPVESWLSGAPYEWSYHVFWSFIHNEKVFLEQWSLVRDQTSEIVGGLWPDDPDGRAAAKVDKRLWKEAGYEVVSPGFFPPGLKDFSTIINSFKDRNVDIVKGDVAPPTMHIFMRQCVEMNYHPKIVSMGKGALFPAAMNALGELSEGVSSTLWWSPYHPYTSSLTEESTEKISNQWEEETGKQWTPPLGYSHAGVEIVVDSIKRAGCLKPENLRRAIANTDLDTIVGSVDFKDIPAEGEAPGDIIEQYRKHVSLTPIVGCQWFKGDEWPWIQEVTNNLKYEEIPVTADFTFPKPWPE